MSSVTGFCGRKMTMTQYVHHLARCMLCASAHARNRIRMVADADTRRGKNDDLTIIDER